MCVFFEWFLFLSITSLKFTHVVRNFLFQAEKYSTVHADHIMFIHSPSNRHLGGSHPLAGVNITALNTGVQTGYHWLKTVLGDLWLKWQGYCIAARPAYQACIPRCGRTTRFSSCSGVPHGITYRPGFWIHVSLLLLLLYHHPSFHFKVSFESTPFLCYLHQNPHLRLCFWGTKQRQQMPRGQGGKSPWGWLQGGRHDPEALHTTWWSLVSLLLVWVD